jgi:hypothetical protein
MVSWELFWGDRRMSRFGGCLIWATQGWLEQNKAFWGNIAAVRTLTRQVNAGISLGKLDIVIL